MEENKTIDDSKEEKTAPEGWLDECLRRIVEPTILATANPNHSRPIPSINPSSNEDYARRKKYVKFGTKVLGLKDLTNNILNIRYPTYNSIPDFRKVPISPLFSSIVHGYLQIPNLSKETFVENPQEKNLSNEEKLLMGYLLRRTAVRSGAQSIRNEQENIKDRKRELRIMLGIRQAGNNSPEMAMKILKNAKYLKTKGQLSRQMVSDIIESLSETV
jgi:hypothetical protein